MEFVVGYEEVGLVFWYGCKFYGYCIFSGELFDMYCFIVVYWILLLFIYVRVINLDNGKSLVVCVNDWGLFYFECIIDLFWVVVVWFGIEGKGIGCVWVEVLIVCEKVKFNWEGMVFIVVCVVVDSLLLDMVKVVVGDELYL